MVRADASTRPPLWLALPLGLCTAFVAIAFLGGTPTSARGLYYVSWLLICSQVWKRRESIREWLLERKIPEFALYMGLAVTMILAEETLAGICVHLLQSSGPLDLLRKVPPYYANNLLLLPGFMLGWYVLIKRFMYTPTEVFVMVGLFGLYSEKIYLHVLSIPVLGIPLIPTTMFTYMGIILIPILALRSVSTRRASKWVRYPLGMLFPILTSIPFVAIHLLLTKWGWIDPRILAH